MFPCSLYKQRASSPTPSCVSLKSDHSINHPPDLNKGDSAEGPRWGDVILYCAICSVGRHLNPNGLIDGTDALAHIGPYLASSAIDLITGACVVACLQLAQSVLFPPAPRVGKLGNDLAPQGAARPYEEACSGANVPWCNLPFQKPLAPQTRKYLV